MISLFLLADLIKDIKVFTSCTLQSEEHALPSRAVITNTLLYFVPRQDPERPESLEDLEVVKEEDVTVKQKGDEMWITVEFTPTVPHCSLATLIGMSVCTPPACSGKRPHAMMHSSLRSLHEDKTTTQLSAQIQGGHS